MRKHSITVWSEVKKDDHHVMIDNNPQKKIIYTYKNIYDEHLSSNPGELMAASHAGSFSMKLSSNLTEAGYFPEMLETTCDIVVDNGVIIKSELTLTAKVNDISDDIFQEIASYTLLTCPISKALNIKIKLKATVEQNAKLINRLMDTEFAY